MRVFWDTNLFIYLWEEGPNQLAASKLAEQYITSGISLVTSPLTVGEIQTGVLRTGDSQLAQSYAQRLARLEIVAFDFAVAQSFAALRARHPGLKAPDAIQLACALHGRCDQFVTNDQRLCSLDRHLPLDVTDLDTAVRNAGDRA